MPKPKFIIEEPVVEATVEPIKKKGRKPKAVLDEDAKTITDTSSKKISYILDDSAPSEVLMAETKEEPLIVKKVHKIVLTKFMHSGKYYYLDMERDKLYTYTGDQQHGDYVGRWDSHLEKIISIAEDSDLE